MVKSGYETKAARIEILPLIDVIFLLLVFFIYAMVSMVTNRGLKVELPKAMTAQVNQQEYIGITIKADNQLFVNKNKVTLEELIIRVTALVENDESLPVIVSGDRRADLGVAIEILDRLNQAEIRKVSFECTEESL